MKTKHERECGRDHNDIFNLLNGRLNDKERKKETREEGINHCNDTLR